MYLAFDLFANNIWNHKIVDECSCIISSAVINRMQHMEKSAGTSKAIQYPTKFVQYPLKNNTQIKQFQ